MMLAITFLNKGYIFMYVYSINIRFYSRYKFMQWIYICIYIYMYIYIYTYTKCNSYIYICIYISIFLLLDLFPAENFYLFIYFRRRDISQQQLHDAKSWWFWRRERRRFQKMFPWKCIQGNTFPKHRLPTLIVVNELMKSFFNCL